MISRTVGICQSSPLTSVYPLNFPVSISSRIRSSFSGLIMNTAAEAAIVQGLPVYSNIGDYFPADRGIFQRR